MNPKNTLCLIVDIQERLLPALPARTKCWNAAAC